MRDLGKKFNITSGLLFLLAGLSLFGLSATFYLDPVQGVSLSQVKANAVNSCAAKFNGNKTYMGMNTEVKDDYVYVTAYGLDEWEGKLNMASHITSACGGMSLHKFCFGESCDLAKITGEKTRIKEHMGMFLSLKFDKSNIDPRVDMKKVSE